MTSISEIVLFVHPSVGVCTIVHNTLRKYNIPFTLFNVKSKKAATTVNKNFHVLGVPAIMVVYGDGRTDIFNGIQQCNQFIDYLLDVNRPTTGSGGGSNGVGVHEIPPNHGTGGHTEHGGHTNHGGGDDGSSLGTDDELSGESADDDDEDEEPPTPQPGGDSKTGKINIADILKKAEHDREKIEKEAKKKKLK